MTETCSRNCGCSRKHAHSAHGAAGEQKPLPEPSYTAEDLFEAYILGMDTFALGLLKAEAIINDGRIDAFVKERYSSYSDGIGKKIREKATTLEELASIADEMGAPALPSSGKQEYLEAVVNQVLFGGK